MTVAELRRLLEAFPQDALVAVDTEGGLLGINQASCVKASPEALTGLRQYYEYVEEPDDDEPWPTTAINVVVLGG